MSNPLGAVTLTPGTRTLTAVEQIGWAAAEHERAQQELERTRRELDEAIDHAERSDALSVADIAVQIGTTRQTVYNSLKRSRG